MKFLNSRWAICFATFFLSHSAYGAAIPQMRVGGGLSYENVKTPGESREYTGFGFQGLFDAQVYSITPSTQLLVGLATRYFSVTREVNDIQSRWTQFKLGPSVGLLTEVNPQFSISSTLGREFGFSGKISQKIGSGTEISRDTESFEAMVTDWRFLYLIAPKMEMGAGLGYQWGTTDVANSSPNLDFRGWNFSILFGYRI